MIKAKPHCCEEAVPGIWNAYLPCNRPATKIVDVNRPGSTEGPYRMCDSCADHNVRNRGMKVVGPYVASKPETASTYLEAARLIVAGKLPLKDSSISPGQWTKAQEIVGKMLGASNETYVHPNLLYGLCEKIADGLNDYFEMGKFAGGTVVEDRKR